MDEEKIPNHRQQTTRKLDFGAIRKEILILGTQVFAGKSHTVSSCGILMVSMERLI